jgi:hypothetical protein
MEKCFCCKSLVLCYIPGNCHTILKITTASCQLYCSNLISSTRLTIVCLAVRELALAIYLLPARKVHSAVSA